jgi:Pyruvate/2-oxoacid:ferredoxin oxidoreductase delta subunit
MNGSVVSRRELFSRFLRPLEQRAGNQNGIRRTATTSETRPMVAVIQGRHCLSYQKSFCSACYERCPVPGAIEMRQGVPSVVPDACTGCGVCHEVCPAPRNAVLLILARRGAVDSTDARNNL